MKKKTAIKKLVQLGQEFEPIRKKVLSAIENDVFIQSQEILELLFSEDTDEKVTEVLKDVRKYAKALQKFSEKYDFYVEN